MYCILQSSSGMSYLIVNTTTGMETPWEETLGNACRSVYCDTAGSSALDPERGTVILQTDTQPTWNYIQLHHPELLI